MIDASIPLGVKPVQIENPVNAMARIMQMQGLQQDQQLGRMKMDEYQRSIGDKNRMQSILSQTYAKPEEREDALLRGGFVDQATKLSTDRRANQKTDADTEKTALESKFQKLTLTGQLLSTVRDQATYDQARATAQAHGLDVSRMPPQFDPAFIQSRIQESQSIKDQLEQVWKQKGYDLQVNQHREVVRHNTTTEGETGRHNRSSEGIQVRGQNMTERHFQANQNAPQYMETDAGLVALPKKLAPGQQPTGTPVMGADGQPLSKPLKAIPPAVNGAIIQNTQSMNQIDRALALLDGKDVGDPAKGGQRGDKNATGAKAYLPQGILNRVDPKGVDARAEISDVGSLKIHDRSGAAVTISESPRLMPFVPLATDDAATVKKKLSRLRTELMNEGQALQQTYSRDQGYRPSPVQPAAPAAKPSVTNW